MMDNGLKIGIIGSGHVGCSFALGLKNKGLVISGVYSKTKSSFEYICRLLKTNYINDLNSTIGNSDLVLITVSDSEIRNVVSEIINIVDAKDIVNKNFFHCSGALTSEELQPLNILGAYTASFHPIQTFPDKEDSWRGLQNIYFGFEGCIEARAYAEKIINIFESHMIEVSKENKPIYHAIACILSNYIVTLSHVAEKLFETVGIESATGIKAFMPLMQQTVKNINNLGSIDALTGPIARGDCNVIKGHVEALKTACPECLDIYKELGKATVNLAVEKNSITNNRANEIKILLD